MLIITLEYPPQAGGIASYVYNYAKHATPESVVVYAPPLPHADELDKASPWKVYRRRPYWFLVWPHWLRLFFQVFRIIRREKITRLDIHQALPGGYVGYLIKKFKKIPYTIFLHGTDLALATRGSLKLKNFKKVCANAERVVVNSEFLKKKLLEHVEITAPITVVYPCPADTFSSPVTPEKIAKIKEQLALQGKKIILTVARMVEGKGYPHAIRMLPEILKEVPNVVWLMIGLGPKQQEIFDAVHKHYLQNVVRFLGQISFADLPTYYQASDVFVLLTHPDEGMEEGWGTVFLEAGASGLPVVAGRSGGVEEAVENGVTGVVVDVHQDKAVIKAIVDLLKNPEWARQMGEAGKKRVAEEFTWDNQLSKLK